jgi:hypothetical protein
MNAEFKDINFKLCALQILMYEKNLLTAKFDVWEFVENYTARKIDVDEEGYRIIPEVLHYFKNFPIDAALLAEIDEIYQDGGNEIYMKIIPFWDGEDDEFNVTSTEDVALFPNLKKMTIFYDKSDAILQELQSKGIDTKYL